RHLSLVDGDRLARMGACGLCGCRRDAARGIIRVMGMPSILALVTDAFGGEGGIARYNRDLLEALASAGYSVRALPRAARKGFALPGGIQQDPPRRGRIAFAVAALLAGIRYRPELVFCGHLFLAPLAFLIARLTRAKLIIQMHGIEALSQPSQLQRAAVETAD